VGAFVAGIVDVGASLLPRDLAFPSMVGDVMRLVSDMFPTAEEKLRGGVCQQTKSTRAWDKEQAQAYRNRHFVPQSSKKKKGKNGVGYEPPVTPVPVPSRAVLEECPYEVDTVEADEWITSRMVTPPVESESSSEDFDFSTDDILPEEYKVVSKLSQLRTGLMVLFQKHRGRLAMVFIGSILGALLYMVMHKKYYFKKERQPGAFEAKGKTKQGRDHSGGDHIQTKEVDCLR
jgi:hypothetical protein